jgi:agmatine deiminase
MPLIHFDFIPYPLWRRRGLEAARPLMNVLTASGADVLADGEPPHNAAHMAHYLNRWGILPPGMSVYAARDALPDARPPICPTDHAAPIPAIDQPIRLPAQWETMEAIILSFPVLYPPLWETHAQLIEAISQVARADVLIPHEAWAAAIWLFLERRAFADLTNVRLIILPTDDIWVRDYGAFTGYLPDGSRAAVKAAYDPLPSYPQDQDDAMPARYAAFSSIPLRVMDLHTEGGNFWSDGAGTLIASEGIYSRNPHLSRSEVERRLRGVFAFDKLIVTPSLWREETGHVDLLVKLADADTVLISAPTVPFNGGRLRETAKIFQRETNASGQPYQQYTLPAPSPYLNWGFFPIWRTYTNSLTVNGRVLVPVFYDGADETALAVYRAAMPDHEVIPILCANAVNGGGAVHCLTKEVCA